MWLWSSLYSSRLPLGLIVGKKEAHVYCVLGSVLLIFNTPDKSEQFYRGGNGAIGRVTNLFMVTQQDMVGSGLRTRFMCL